MMNTPRVDPDGGTCDKCGAKYEQVEDEKVRPGRWRRTWVCPKCGDEKSEEITKKLKYTVEKEGEKIEDATQEEVRELLSGLTCGECGRPIKPVKRDTDSNTTTAACRVPVEDACESSLVTIKTHGEDERYDGSPKAWEVNIQSLEDLLSESREWGECPKCGEHALVPWSYVRIHGRDALYKCANCGESASNWKDTILEAMSGNDEDESDISAIQYASAYGGEPENADSLDVFDYYRNTGFGGATCDAVRIFTEEHIYLTSNYDGSQSIVSVSRNPSDESIVAPGGG